MVPTISSIFVEINNILVNMIRKIINLHDGLQLEVFRTIASFPAISLPVLELTLNELARVFQSNRGVSLGEPDPFLEQGGGWGVTTRAKGKIQLAETDINNDEDEKDEEEISEDEWPKLRRRKVKI